MTPLQESGSTWRPWEIERDRFGVMFSGPLEVGECRRVVPCDDAAVERAAQALLDEAREMKGWPRIPLSRAADPSQFKRAAEVVLRAAGETP